MNRTSTTLLIGGIIFLLFFSALGAAQEQGEDEEQACGGTELLPDELDVSLGEGKEHLPGVDINITEPGQLPDDLQFQDPNLTVFKPGSKAKDDDEPETILQRLKGDRLRQELPRNAQRDKDLVTAIGSRAGEDVGVPLMKGALKVGTAPRSGKLPSAQEGKEVLKASIEGGLDTFIGKNPLKGDLEPTQVQISDIQVAMVASTGIFFLFGAIFSGGSSAKATASMAPFIPLYSRIHKDEVFKHQRRQFLYQLVMSNPGISFKHLKELTELQNGALRHHLTTLERERYIKSIRDGKRRRFYLNGKKVSPLSATQQQILSHIRENPKVSQAEIAALMGVSRQNINYHLKKMEKDHILRVQQGEGGQSYEVFERRW